MALQIESIACRQDNYAWLLHDTATGTTALVDAPEAAPILAALDKHGWRLDLVLITHHHHDHVDGLAALRAAHAPKVAGCAADAARLPPLDIALSEGDEIAVGAHKGRVMDVSGHTLHHIAFHFADAGAVFTADSLMALGCGRVFEGTMDQMFASLSKLAALAPETLVCSGHEYTQSNARFALSVDGNNPALLARAASVDAARAQGLPTVPSTLELELATNPFMRCGDRAIRAGLGMGAASDAQVFAELRQRKDRF